MSPLAEISDNELMLLIGSGVGIWWLAMLIVVKREVRRAERERQGLDEQQ